MGFYEGILEIFSHGILRDFEKTPKIKNVKNKHFKNKRLQKQIFELLILKSVSNDNDLILL